MPHLDLLREFLNLVHRYERQHHRRSLLEAIFGEEGSQEGCSCDLCKSARSLHRKTKDLYPRHVPEVIVGRTGQGAIYHALDYEGRALCKARSHGGWEARFGPVTCKRCLGMMRV